MLPKEHTIFLQRCRAECQHCFLHIHSVLNHHKCHDLCLNMQAKVQNRNTYPINSTTNTNIRELFQHPGKRTILGIFQTFRLSYCKYFNLFDFFPLIAQKCANGSSNFMHPKDLKIKLIFTLHLPSCGCRVTFDLCRPQVVGSGRPLFFFFSFPLIFFF